MSCETHGCGAQSHRPTVVEQWESVMDPRSLGGRISVLRSLGSLWFGSLVLVLLLLAMACATVYESMHSAESALRDFYQAWWFQLLLALLAVNVAAAVVLRYPFTRRQIGFVCTHASILLILGGALVTHRFGVDGQLALGEGETAKEFNVSQTALTVVNGLTRAREVVELSDGAFRGTSPVERAPAAFAQLDGVKVQVERYLPDAVPSERVVNDNPEPRRAVEVSLTGAATVGPVWVFEDRGAKLEGGLVALRVIERSDELQELLADQQPARSDSKGSVQLEYQGMTREIALEPCLTEAVPIPGTDLSVRVLRYLPHATVGPDNKLVNVSDQPMNPAIEAEILGPDGAERRVAFARFPDFRSMHGGAATQELKLTFLSSAGATPQAPIEILAAPSGDLHVRFAAGDGRAVSRAVVLETPVASPWDGSTLTVHRRFTHARQDRVYEPFAGTRETRSPAMWVSVSGPSSKSNVWLERRLSRSVTVDGTPYDLTFGDKIVPLGFEVTLNRFTLGRYPGENRPRSFESQLTIADPAAGRSQSRVVSMNHPTKYGGYTFFQSSYSLEGKQAVSVLSISRDPGLPIVFTGYITLLAGMVTVLLTRIPKRQRTAEDEPTLTLRDRGRPEQSLPIGTGCRTTPPRRVAWSKSAVFLVLMANASVLPFAEGTSIPVSIDPAVLREVPVQHDGRWPPLDTVARDLVRSVTGDSYFDGRDPVLTLLAWTFDPGAWTKAPLICIGNAELRGELHLSPTQTVFSYAEMVSHPRLQSLIEELSSLPRGQKPDPLQSKVGDIHEKLLLLQRVFAGKVIRPIPDAADFGGAWLPISPPQAADAPSMRATKEAWGKVRAAFLADEGAAFSTSSRELASALATLPAAYRPDAGVLATELAYNRIRPFHRASEILLAVGGLAALGMVVRRRWFDSLVFVATLTGFAVLSYGLALRWQIAGRIPASNMFESLLFLGWGAAGFAMIAVLVFRERLVPLTAAGISATALFLADRLPMDQFIRPIAPVLLDTVWMSIHVPIIMVSYSVLALAVLIAHIQLVGMAVAPAGRARIERMDTLHYWYVQIGSLLLAAGIITGSMWAASSWGRYWGWDPKEVWSLVALLGYLCILHVRIDRDRVPPWAYGAGGLMVLALFAVMTPKLAPITVGKSLGLVGAAGAVVLLLTTRGAFATAVKSILCFWLIVMTYVGVNYVLGAGLHSYGFGTGAVARSMFLTGGADLVIVAICCVVYLWRRAPERGRLSLSPVTAAV